MRVNSSGKVLACVIGDMDLVRPLGLAGIPCAVVAPAGSPTLYSRFAKAALLLDHGAEADLLESLVRFGETQPERPVLFYEGDAELQLIARNQDRLADVFRFVLADPALVESLVDKGKFWKLAEQLDLPVPRSTLIRPSEHSSPFELDLAFPVIVKPLVRLETWEAVGGSYKALQVDTATALRELWPLLAASGMEFLVQEMIPGPESQIESYHVYVDGQGEVAAEFTGRKIRTLPTSHGHSTSLVLTDADDVAKLGRELVRKLALTGVAKFDFKRTQDGTLKLLEVNPRFTLWHHLAAVAGLNIPALVYADLLGQPRPAVQRPTPGTRWCTPLNDWRAAKESDVSLSRWLAWALTCEAKSRFAWDDPMPFLRPKLDRLLAKAGLGRANGASADVELAKS